MALGKAEMDQWFSFLGYGAIDAAVWFVGIEPGGDPSQRGTDQTLSLKPVGDDQVRWDPCPEPVPASQRLSLAWRRPLEIMAKLNGAPAGADLRVNWDQRWSHVMAANMAPLPRIRETDRHMGLDRQAYRDQVRTQRGPLFARLFNDRQALPQLRVMVFHGLGAWRHYQFGHQFSVEPEASWPSIPGAPAFKTVCDMGRRRVIVGPSLTRASRVSCDALTEQLRVWSRQDDDWRTTI